VLSDVVQELVRDSLPTGVGLLDLGEHRLKDLFRPERVFQLVAPDLPNDFPPLRTLDTQPNNLPVQPTPFIGRDRELKQIAEILCRPAVRLLTLTGVGGTGKSRLGVQVAADLLDHFKDGVFFVPLDLLTDPALVPSALAASLDVQDTSSSSHLEALKRHLRRKQILLVLDNCEHVLDACSVVGELLMTCPTLKVLATSRAILHLAGEHEYPVPPLLVPNLRQLTSVEMLTQFDALALFHQRARAVRPDFEVTSENAAAIVEICYRLDGLPLAIELAAARIRLFPPAALLSRLSKRLPLLTGGARDVPARQQTLRGAIAWSYDLLSAEQQKLFARVAAFTGGCTLDAAETVCNFAGDLPEGVISGVEALVEQSLLRQTEQPDGEPRFLMLETIREYALVQLLARGETNMVFERQAQYCAHFAEEAEEQLTGPKQRLWLERLEQEHDNIRAALRWALDHGEAGVALRVGRSGVSGLDGAI
jgi:predicted ATPase